MGVFALNNLPDPKQLPQKTPAKHQRLKACRGTHIANRNNKTTHVKTQKKSRQTYKNQKYEPKILTTLELQDEDIEGLPDRRYKYIYRDKK